MNFFKRPSFYFQQLFFNFKCFLKKKIIVVDVNSDHYDSLDDFDD